MNSRSRPRADGCGFLLATCGFTCLFLFLNGVLVAAGYTVLSSHGPPILRHPKLTQAILFIAPVVLIFVEWWLVDTTLHGLQKLRQTTFRRSKR